MIVFDPHRPSSKWQAIFDRIPDDAEVYTSPLMVETNNVPQEKQKQQ